MTAVAPVDFQNTVFDVLIAGSGFGGATAAYALSRAGLRVLLIERGGWPNRDETDWNGRAILLEGRYRSETPLLVRQEGATRAVETFPNEVVGGNSVFFGGATLRLRATDFSRWPISYADLEPHYAAAEALLEVHGRAGEDPCGPPRTGDYPFPPLALTAPARRIYDAATALGLHPFQLPVAIDHFGSARASLPQLLHLRRVSLPDRRQERHDPDGAQEGRSDQAHHPGAHASDTSF